MEQNKTLKAYGLERTGNDFVLVEIEETETKEDFKFKRKIVFKGEKAIALGLLRKKIFYDYKDL